MTLSNQSQLGSGSIGKLLFQLSLPAILAQIINVLYNMVDRIYIGHIPSVGADALTGVGITMPVIMAVSAFAALVSMGGAPRAAIMMGRKDQDHAERILGNSTTMLIFLSLFLTLVILIFSKPILMVFGASSNTLPYAMDYLNIYALGTIFVQLSLGLNAFITTQGFAKTSMYTVMIGAACNIILDPIFIFGFHMGVKGAAIATIISQAISCIWVMRFLTGEKTTLKIKKHNLKLRFSIILPCLALGLAPFIMQFTESIITVCFNISLLKYGGDIAVGAMTILISVMQFSMLPLQGLTQGAQPIISFNFGAKNPERIKKTFALLLTVSIGYATFLWLICMIFPHALPALFTNNSELIEYSAWAIRIYMLASFMLGIQTACQQTFIALGNAKASIFLALLRKVILLIPLIFILPNLVSNQAMGVFLAEPIADFCAVCVTSALFFATFRKTLRSLNESAK